MVMLELSVSRASDGSGVPKYIMSWSPFGHQMGSGGIRRGWDVEVRSSLMLEFEVPAGNVEMCCLETNSRASLKIKASFFEKGR